LRTTHVAARGSVYFFQGFQFTWFTLLCPSLARRGIVSRSFVFVMQIAVPMYIAPTIDPLAYFSFRIPVVSISPFRLASSRATGVTGHCFIRARRGLSFLSHFFLKVE